MKNIADRLVELEDEKGVEKEEEEEGAAWVWGCRLARRRSNG